MTIHPRLYPASTGELAPKPLDAFKAFSAAVFADGALPGKAKQLIAAAVAYVTQCPYCIRGHTQAAMKAGASEQEIMEATGWRPRCAPAEPMRTQRWLLAS